MLRKPTLERDWAATLRDQRESAEAFARLLPTIIGAPDLTLQQAHSLYRTAEQSAAAVDRIALQMKLASADRDLLTAGEALQDLWADLCLSAFDAMRKAQRRQA